MAFFVYILRCSDGSYYTGQSDDLERRVSEHWIGADSGCYTFRRRPVELVWSQALATREQAVAVERQLKGWTRRKKEALLQADWRTLSELAHQHGTRG